jgi:LexA-binding, inner membrane-associated putative hydrolase
VDLMPVLGHAVVGLAIGLSTKPAPRERREAARMETASALWLPAVVVLAYLPDIVAQLGLIAGWSDSRLLGHSVVCAAGASVVIAAVATRLAGVSFPRAFVTVLVSLLIHDVLDLGQATDRAPWWPLSDRPIGVQRGLVPTGLVPEAALFGGLLVAFLALRHAWHRWVSGRAVDLPRPGEGHARLVWLGRAVIVAVVVAAVVTHALRDARESQLDTARVLVEQHAYQAGLDTLARAEPWPSTARPGRIDYVRAEAYAGMGDRQRAEVYYLRAYRADRTYFWAVADLALFYASSDAPEAERRHLVAPYVSRLRSGFAGHPALPGVLARVERRLAAPPHAAAPDSPATPDEHAPVPDRSDD